MRAALADALAEIEWSSGSPSGAFCSKLAIDDTAIATAILRTENPDGDWSSSVEVGFEKELRKGCTLSVG
eukprot:SAG11_NODE_37843_length_255_cov_0.647436_1_plen_70_part_00